MGASQNDPKRLDLDFPNPARKEELSVPDFARKLVNTTFRRVLIKI